MFLLYIIMAIIVALIACRWTYLENEEYKSRGWDSTDEYVPALFAGLIWPLIVLIAVMAGSLWLIKKGAAKLSVFDKLIAYLRLKL